MSGYGGNINYYLPWYEYDPPWWMQEKPERRRSKWAWRWRHWTRCAKHLPRPKWTPDPKAFSFLSLPRELRDAIYEFASLYHLPVEYDGPVKLPAPESSGLLSYCATPPPRNLLLVNKQIRSEVLAKYYSESVFEIPPLAPHDTLWRLDPGYDMLTKSPILPKLTRLHVTVELTNLAIQQAAGGMWSDAKKTEWYECDLPYSARLVRSFAGKLVEVLLERAKFLKRLVVDWVDDFPNGDLQLKGTIVKHFERLQERAIDTVLGRLVIADIGRMDVRSMLRNSGLE